MNEKIPAISVIIPMFNAEKYIEQCLDSIADQTFEDYEVIVVDDCSTDRSVALTEAFYERKIGGQFHLLKLPENSGGASIPRNQALKLARGKYVTFVDSDDLLIDNALEILFNVAEKFQADVVDAEKFFVRRDGFGINTNSGMTVTSWQTAPFVNKPTLETNDIDERVVAFCQRRFSNSIWGKLYLRRFLIENQIEFADIYSEDLIFVSFCVCCANNYVRIPNVIYIYREVPTSLSHSHSSLEKEIGKIVQPVAGAVHGWNKHFSRLKIFKEHPELKFALINYFFRTRFVIEGYIYQQFPMHAFEPFMIHEFSEYDGKESATIMTYLFNIAAMNYLHFRQSQQLIAELQRELQKLKSM